MSTSYSVVSVAALRAWSGLGWFSRPLGVSQRVPSMSHCAAPRPQNRRRCRRRPVDCIVSGCGDCEVGMNGNADWNCDGAVRRRRPTMAGPDTWSVIPPPLGHAPDNTAAVPSAPRCDPVHTQLQLPAEWRAGDRPPAIENPYQLCLHSCSTPKIHKPDAYLMHSPDVEHGVDRRDSG